MAKKREELTARGFVYCMVWEGVQGDRFTRKGIVQTALARIGRDREARRPLDTLVMLPSTVYRPLMVLEQARVVKREASRGSRGEVVWVRQGSPRKFSTDLLVVRGAPRDAVDEMLKALAADRQVELCEDGLWHDTRVA